MSALHASQPIAGLRSSGKGANRTILDCLFRRIGARNKGLSAAAGVAGAGNLPCFVLSVAWGGSTGCSLGKGLVQ
jgi:hypothetical protein